MQHRSLRYPGPRLASPGYCVQALRRSSPVSLALVSPSAKVRFILPLRWNPILAGRMRSTLMAVADLARQTAVENPLLNHLMAGLRSPPRLRRPALQPELPAENK